MGFFFPKYIVFVLEVNMSTKIRNVFLFCFETLMIIGITLLCVLPFSCKVTESGIKILDGDYVCPKLLYYNVMDSKNVKIGFSEPVVLKSHVVSTDSEKRIPTSVLSDEFKKDVTIIFDKEMIVGEEYQFVGVVKDEFGNSLTLELPFTGYNPRVPKLIMTEIQTVTVTSRTKTETENDMYKTEFIEFVALSDGNLSGIDLFSVYDGEDRIFNFPAVEVKKGEVFLVHFRNKGNGCTNEDSDNLSLATAPYSKNGVRDFWIDNPDTALGNKTDVILLRNTANGKILDALVYSESKYEDWASKFEDYIYTLSKTNIYDSLRCCDVINGDEMGKTKTLQRTNAKEILREFIENEDSEYPVRNEVSAWVVTDNSAGSL